MIARIYADVLFWHLEIIIITVTLCYENFRRLLRNCRCQDHRLDIYIVKPLT